MARKRHRLFMRKVIRRRRKKRQKRSSSRKRRWIRKPQYRYGTFKDQVPKFKCGICGSQDNLTVDHKHPVSKGGKTKVINLWWLCFDCNQYKGSKLFTASKYGFYGVLVEPQTTKEQDVWTPDRWYWRENEGREKGITVC